MFMTFTNLSGTDSCGPEKSNNFKWNYANCTYGPKQPFYWYQNERNNMLEGTYTPPLYLDLYNFHDGAQNDIFLNTTTVTGGSSGGSALPAASNHATTSGSVALAAQPQKAAAQSTTPAGAEPNHHHHHHHHDSDSECTCHRKGSPHQ